MAAGSDTVGERKTLQVQPGDVIWCRTFIGEEYEGEVMGYDESTQAVVIKSAPGKTQSKAVYDVSIINLNFVDHSNFKLIERSRSDPPPLPDLDKVKTERRLKTAKERVGVGVSPEGQQLFDFIQKRISDCMWDGQNIVVLRDIEIKPPYQLENCTGHDKSYIEQMMTKFYSENPSAVIQSLPATT